MIITCCLQTDFENRGVPDLQTFSIDVHLRQRALRYETHRVLKNVMPINREGIGMMELST